MPQSTCDSIASYLPVTYDKDLGLYLWNTTASSFAQIVSLPHFLRLTFTSGSSTADIDVPFTLLNLTLDTPIVSTPTQYFPCSPYSPSDGSTYHLGRAFLQAAFLAQNWQTSTLWLAHGAGVRMRVLGSEASKGYRCNADSACQPADVARYVVRRAKAIEWK